jgi:hypothetical protein
LDVMIITACAAVAFFLMRQCWPRSGGFSPHAVREWANATLGVTLLPWSVAFLVIRLIPPRPGRERLMCQPGMAACCAALVVIACGIFARILPGLRNQFVSPSRPGLRVFDFLDNFWYVYQLPVGPAVAMVWLGLVLAGRWRPERGWIDRFGRVLGVLWITFVLFQWQFGRWTSSLAMLLAPLLRQR